MPLLGLLAVPIHQHVHLTAIGDVGACYQSLRGLRCSWPVPKGTVTGRHITVIGDVRAFRQSPRWLRLAWPVPGGPLLAVISYGRKRKKERKKDMLMGNTLGPSSLFILFLYILDIVIS